MALKRNRLTALILVLAFLAVSLFTAAPALAANGDGVITAEIGYYVEATAKSTILNRLNQIRKEACDQGVIFNGTALSSKDYVPLRWSKEMENLALKRVAEARLMPGKTRPNGKSWNTATSDNGYYSDVELIGTEDTLMENIEEWYRQKAYAGSKEAEGYLAIINPAFQFAGAVSSEISVLEFSSNSLQDETQIYAEPDWYSGKLETLPANLDLQINGSTRFSPEDGGYLYLTAGPLLIEGSVSWSSDAPSVIAVDEYGVLTAGRTGKAVITAEYLGETVSAQVRAISPVWRHNAHGWWYDFGDGTYPQNEFLLIDGETYLFDNLGYMVTGWANHNNKRYYMYTNGVRAYGWLHINNSWYYLDDDTGAMVTGWLNKNGNRYYINSNGVMVTGWVKEGNSWYYMDTSGAMMTGWLRLNSKTYYLNSDGKMAVGWVKDGNSWYYMNSSGEMTSSSWLLYNKIWYYLNADGKMAVGWVKVNNTWYYMNTSGAMMTGWVKDGADWYYMDSNGNMKIGWLTQGSTKYYLRTNGTMATGWVSDQNHWYYMNPSSGAMMSGPIEVYGKKYYLGTNGMMQTGWATIGGREYYYGTDGAAYTNGIYRINGATYAFDKDGVKAAYVLNNTDGKHEFHTVNCVYVARINPAVRGYSAASRSTLIQQGYQPCTHCKP